MTCSRCGLPFTADYPEYNPGAGYHEAGACIRGLCAALTEAANPDCEREKGIVDTAYAAGLNDGRDESAATIEKLQAQAADNQAIQQSKNEQIHNLIKQNREMAHLCDTRVSESEAELAKLREQYDNLWAAADVVRRSMNRHENQARKENKMISWSFLMQWQDTLEKAMPPAPEVTE